jgi:hypothetical protein
MYIKINRDVCGHQIAVCERCLGRVLTNPYGYERHCFEEIIDDGSDILTLDITSTDNHWVLELNEEERLLMAGEGWAKIAELRGLF